MILYVYKYCRSLSVDLNVYIHTYVARCSEELHIELMNQLGIVH